MPLDFSQIRKGGTVIEFQGAPYVILSTSFQRAAQRKPTVSARLRNLLTGRIIEYSFKFGEKVEEADVVKTNAQFLYKDPGGVHFMDSETFETVDLPKDLVEGVEGYLKESMEVKLVKYQGKPISVEMPIKIDLKVVSTPPGVKGDTVTGGTKPATLETGLVVYVPLFIKEGDLIRINTESGEYVERAN
ncbi:elongation factor P [bacterium]|nr:MAG: elongation factor P [bacterium]